MEYRRLEIQQRSGFRTPVVTYRSLECIMAEDMIKELKTYSTEFRMRTEMMKLSDSVLEELINQCESSFVLSKKRKFVPIAKGILKERRESKLCITIEGLSIPQKYADYIDSFYSQTRMYAVDYKTLYQNVPDILVSRVACFLPSSANDGADSSYEAILRSYIEVAKDVNNNYIKAIDGILKFCIGWGGIQRTSLCVTWALLLFDLFSKFTNTITEDERNRIARGGIALAFGTSIAVIQYFHKSPYGITNYLRLLYEGYNNVRDWCNQHFSYQIPDVLCMESPRKQFAEMTNDEKITVGQMLNMIYTFRVGDMYLEVCSKSENKIYLTDETILSMIDTDISPLPESEEIEKLYKLYTDEKLYKL